MLKTSAHFPNMHNQATNGVGDNSSRGIENLEGLQSKLTQALAVLAATKNKANNDRVSVELTDALEDLIHQMRQDQRASAKSVEQVFDKLVKKQRDLTDDFKKFTEDQQRTVNKTLQTMAAVTAELKKQSPAWQRRASAVGSAVADRYGFSDFYQAATTRPGEHGTPFHGRMSNLARTAAGRYGMDGIFDALFKPLEPKIKAAAAQSDKSAKTFSTAVDGFSKQTTSLANSVEVLQRSLKVDTANEAKGRNELIKAVNKLEDTISTDSKERTQAEAQERLRRNAELNNRALNQVHFANSNAAMAAGLAGIGPGGPHSQDPGGGGSSWMDYLAGAGGGGLGLKWLAGTKYGKAAIEAMKKAKFGGRYGKYIGIAAGLAGLGGAAYESMPSAAESAAHAVPQGASAAARYGGGGKSARFSVGEGTGKVHLPANSNAAIADSVASAASKARVVTPAVRAAAKGLKKLLGPIGWILAAYDGWEQLSMLYGFYKTGQMTQRQFTIEATAVLAGMLGGAGGAALMGSIGGALGTAVEPGVGTAAGALIFSVGGWISGQYGAEVMARRIVDYILRPEGATYSAPAGGKAGVSGGALQPDRSKPLATPPARTPSKPGANGLDAFQTNSGQGNVFSSMVSSMGAPQSPASQAGALVGGMVAPPSTTYGDGAMTPRQNVSGRDAVTVGRTQSQQNAAIREGAGIPAYTPHAPLANPDGSQLPAGMRNNNPGNIKYDANVPWAGLVGPSKNTDQGDPQAVFKDQEMGMRAMSKLAQNKYKKGMRTANQIIASKDGWTGGNFQAAANVAKSMGLGPDDDLQLDNPAMRQKFMRALITQEHGPSGKLYTDEMIAQGDKLANYDSTSGATSPGGGAGKIDMNNANATRNKPLTDRLSDVLNYAGQQAGVDRVEVFSGGQDVKGQGNRRTGSTRHDGGNAADLNLWKDGRKLNFNDPKDRPYFESFVRESAKAGATGIGAGENYMGPNALHVGFGTAATWGAGVGRHAAAPGWLQDSYAQGRKQSSDFSMEKWKQEQENQKRQSIVEQPSLSQSPMFGSLRKNRLSPSDAPSPKRDVLDVEHPREISSEVRKSRLDAAASAAPAPAPVPPPPPAAKPQKDAAADMPKVNTEMSPLLAIMNSTILKGQA